MNPTWVVVGILALVVGNGLLRADPEDRRDKLVALGWGAALSGVGYLVWQSYSVDDLRDGWSWITGDGLPVVGLAVVAIAGYIWYQSAQEADGDPDVFLDELRERTTGPVLQFTGILTAIVVTLLTLLTTSGTSAAMLLGFIGDSFVAAPAIFSNLFGVIVGYVALEGSSIPVIGELLPSVSTTWYLGLTMGALGVAVMARNTGDD